jgi:putative transposase
MTARLSADLGGMRAYSMDLRQRIVAAVHSGGQSQKAVADRFAVSTATVCRYLRWHQERGGNLTPRPIPGAARRIPEELLPELERHLGEHPDTTLELVRTWLSEQHAVTVSVATVHRALRRRGLSYKKRRWSPASGTRPSAPPGATRSRR